MATLIVPGTARYSVLQEIEGRAVVNVLDYKIDTTGTIIDRADAVRDQAGVVFFEWADNIMNWQVDDLQLLGVAYLDLDDADGATGVVNSGGGVNGPVVGVQTPAPLPANVSGLIRKVTTGGRGSRNGRLYLAGLNESQTQATNGNLMESTTATAINSAFAAFLEGTNVPANNDTSYSAELGVVQITARDADKHPTAGVHRPVSALVMDGTLATQRRRLRG